MKSERCLFYVKEPVVVDELERIPQRQRSERLNELLKKALEMEKKEKMLLECNKQAASMSQSDWNERESDGQVIATGFHKQDEDDDIPEGWF
ncbi:hypothetical protein [Halobacteriovorax sp. JY17]|uniref:hypothetical protein n=1 Tax=Halobacteriovorax sp. JY17 TaxID=2014617 RepID=UPI000C55832F|nr:hypothetical protein [Halobacteriovorax sp. JY17]PIK16727.1 MAG: hypothetical protein CES88_08265 [Halobacteriovorax sp. JY17]